MNWRVRKSDDRGVTALEYVSIIGFIAAIMMPAAYMAAQALWGNNGAVAPLQTSGVGRGPYQGPDGPVQGATGDFSYVGGGGAFQFMGIIARNGNLFVEAAAYDMVAGVHAPPVDQAFVVGQWNALYIPQVHRTVFMAMSLPGGTTPTMPTFTLMGTYPKSNEVWSCGC